MKLRTTPRIAAAVTVEKAVAIATSGPKIGVTAWAAHSAMAGAAAFGGPVLSNQVQFSLVNRSPERELVPWAQKEGRVVMAYSPLAQGLLSGRYQQAPPRNFRRMRRGFSAESRERVQPLIDAAKHAASSLPF